MKRDRCVLGMRYFSEQITFLTNAEISTFWNAKNIEIQFSWGKMRVGDYCLRVRRMPLARVFLCTDMGPPGLYFL